MQNYSVRPCKRGNYTGGFDNTEPAHEINYKAILIKQKQNQAILIINEKETLNGPNVARLLSPITFCLCGDKKKH